MRRDVKPIRTKKDYAAALRDIERLWGAKSGTPEGDRLDVLATLVDAYEAVHFPMDPPDPIEAIRFRMEQRGMTRKDLEPLIGTRTRVAEVLNRKRNLSIGMIRRLHTQLGISAEVLIRSTRKERAAVNLRKEKPTAPLDCTYDCP
jgi:HTH-type transcriptional regulator/antitoxin HigA